MQFAIAAVLAFVALAQGASVTCPCDVKIVKITSQVDALQAAIETALKTRE
jgi:outer membrane murein-binding lipoprotein Lpp